SAASKVEQDKKQQAEGLLRQVQAQRGANFSQLAKRYSEDPGSKSRGGYLGAVGRGRFVPAFDTVAWRLAPGAMSGLVRSPFGFHIIRRPPLEEVRDSFRTELATYRGGVFRVRDLARWLFALDQRDVSSIGMASDAQLTEFVRRLAQRELLLREVDSAGVRLTPEDWRGLQTEHDSVLTILRTL